MVDVEISNHLSHSVSQPVLEGRKGSTFPAPPVHPPPRDDGSPPPPGEPSPSDGSPPWGGVTVHHSRPANSSITQLKIFFSVFGACDFLLISYCSWAK